jgi:hypothetical protein
LIRKLRAAVSIRSTVPVVVSGPEESEIVEFNEHTDRFQVGWVSQAVAYYNDPNAYPALPAEDGPDEWARTTNLQSSADQPVTAAAVSDIEVTTNKISFAVDQVGTPVVVKASYFPNWSVDGADGPWRVGPNQMVVVPTDTEVTMSYGRSFVDMFGILLTLLGFGAVYGLRGLDRGRWTLPVLGAANGDIDRYLDDDYQDEGLHADLDGLDPDLDLEPNHDSDLDSDLDLDEYHAEEQVDLAEMREVNGTDQPLVDQSDADQAELGEPTSVGSETPGTRLDESGTDTETGV